MSDGCQAAGIKPGLGNDPGDAVVTMVTQVVKDAASSLVCQHRGARVNIDMARTVRRADGPKQKATTDVDDCYVLVVSEQETNVSYNSNNTQ